MRLKLVIIANAVPSPLNSTIEFARRAQAAGYEVVIFAAARCAEVIAAAGLTHYPIPAPRVDAFAPLVGRDASLGCIAKDGPARRAAAQRTLGVDALRNDLITADPDAVFVDCELHAQLITAYATGLPVICLSTMFLSRPGWRAPPLHRRAIPGQGLIGSRAIILALWCHYVVEKRIKLWRRRRKDRDADFTAALEYLARTLGVRLGKIRRWVAWPMPWAYRLPTVLLLPSQLDLPTRPYQGLTYLGAMIRRDRPTLPHDTGAVDRFCDPDDARKKIYVAFGTTLTPGSNFIQRLCAIAERQPNWQFLVAMGPGWSNRPQNELPGNLVAVTWVPQITVLQAADLMIFHGGTASLCEAVSSGTPMLVYPQSNDQKGSAARVVYHGLGRAGRFDDPVENIETDISAILDDCIIKKTCMRLRQHVESNEFGDALHQIIASAGT